MSSPKDISDMPESEVPWEFLVDAPERRKRDRSESIDWHECYESCERLGTVENRVTLLANEFYTFKRIHDVDTKEASTERKVLLEKLDLISNHLEKQKGFYAGVVWAGSAMLGVIGTAIGLAISYFKG